MSGSWRRIARRPLAKVKPLAVLTCVDRVFQRDDLRVRPVQERESRIERGRLSRARGPGHQDDAVGPRDVALERLEHRRRHLQAVQADDQRLLVQDAADDGLAVHGRERGHAHVHFLASGVEHDAAVLRHAVLGDVHLGHDLHARDDDRQQFVGKHRALHQTPVDAVAAAQHLFLGLDVDVGGALADALAQQSVDQPDVGGIVLAQVAPGLQRAARRLDQLRNVVAPAALPSEMAQRRVLDLALGRVHDFDVLAGQPTQFVGGCQIQRIGHRHLQRASPQPQRQQRPRFGELAFDQVKHGAVDLQTRQIHALDTGLAGQHPRNLAFRADTQTLQRGAELFPGLLLFAQRQIQLLGGQGPRFDQDLPQALGFYLGHTPSLGEAPPILIRPAATQEAFPVRLWV